MAPTPRKPDVNPRTNPKAAGPPAPVKKPAGSIFGAPPPVVSNTGPKGPAWQQFVNYWSSHGYKGLKANANAILLAAHAEHLDPIVFASVLLNETGANFTQAGHQIVSPTGAIGIGQLEPGTFIGPHAWNGGVLPWNKKHQITLADLQDPGINLRLSAAYYGYLQGQFPADAYGRYNAGPNAPDALAGQIQAAFTKKWITTWNPKYVVTTATTSPPAPAGQQVPGGTAQPAPDNKVFKDPYVAGIYKGKETDKNARFTFTNDPNKALQYDGAPLTRSSFLSLKDNLTSHYVSYTGQRPSNAQIQQYIVKGWNPYTLDVLLSKGKNFTKSPIYKQYNANFAAQVKDLLPQGGKIPTELLREAVVNNWDATALAAKLRKLPSYESSNEFAGNVATLLNVHDSVQGNATPQDMVLVKDAALAGWTADQYAAYLRQQPTYTSSTEYQSKALSFLGSLGLITGQQPVMKQGVTPGPGAIQPTTQMTPPADPRVKGKPTVSTPLANLAVTL